MAVRPIIPRKIVKILASYFCKVNEEVLEASLDKRIRKVAGKKNDPKDNKEATMGDGAAKGKKPAPKKK